MAELFALGFACSSIVIALILVGVDRLVSKRKKKTGKNSYYLEQQGKGGL